MFENDGAGDFLAELYHTGPEQRAGVVRQALRAAAEQAGYLEVDEGQAAIAAAAIVAAVRAGQPVTTAASGRTIEVRELLASAPDLLALAVRALDRITGDDSEWHELWQETPDLGAALSTLAQIRTALTWPPAV